MIERAKIVRREGDGRINSYPAPKPVTDDKTVGVTQTDPRPAPLGEGKAPSPEPQLNKPEDDGEETFSSGKPNGFQIAGFNGYLVTVAVAAIILIFTWK